MEPPHFAEVDHGNSARGLDKGADTIWLQGQIAVPLTPFSHGLPPPLPLFQVSGTVVRTRVDYFRRNQAEVRIRLEFLTGQTEILQQWNYTVKEVRSSPYAPARVPISMQPVPHPPDSAASPSSVVRFAALSSSMPSAGRWPSSA